ncbi:MAG: DUF2680 domain-containing protein [Filifactoraceae bacterium]
MNSKKMKKIVAITLASATMLTTGVVAFADNTKTTLKDNGKSAVWNVLTDDQKTQLATEAKEKLAQELADGKITKEQYDSKITAIDNGEMPLLGRKNKMSAEEQAVKDAMKTKWDTLTDAQKNEIYDLYDQKATIDNKIIDKYLDYGLIDSTTATDMKKNIDNRKSDIRTNGKMPGFPGKGMRGDRANKTTNN